MHSHLFEYAVVRVLPKVEREEFLNVGIILFCKKSKYLKTMCRINAPRLDGFTTEADPGLIQQYLNAFEKIAAGEKSCGVIAAMEAPERFRWLTAVRSSVLQTSRPHPGFSEDLHQTLQELFDELVA